MGELRIGGWGREGAGVGALIYGLYTERFFKKQVSMMYVCYIGTMPQLVQIET